VNQRQLSEETAEVTSAQAQQQQLQQQHQQLQQQQLQRRRKHKYEYIDDDERSVRSDSPLNPGLSQVMQTAKPYFLWPLVSTSLQQYICLTCTSSIIGTYTSKGLFVSAFCFCTPDILYPFIHYLQFFNVNLHFCPFCQIVLQNNGKCNNFSPEGACTDDL
jgi:hypothetical protein